jgi:hypothetical protein
LCNKIVNPAGNNLIIYLILVKTGSPREV